MKWCLALIFSVSFGLAVSDEVLLNESEAPRPFRDRFRIIVSDINEERTQEEINDFINYRCEKMVVVRNKAQSDFRLTCKSLHDGPRAANIAPGNSYVFSFRPQKNGETKFWCTVEYKQYISRFDVYNEDASHMCPRDIDEVYQYTVTHEGVFADGKKGSEGNKIHALFKGHNNYIVWEEYQNNQTDGFLISGLIDGGMCADLPEQFNDKAAAVTVCYNHCVHLYEHTGCRGKMQTAQANEDCVDFALNPELVDKLSAIKGC